MKKYFVVSVIACSILFICTSILDNVNFILQADRQSIEKDCGYLYMTIQHESDPTKMPLNINTLGKFISLYKNLSSSALYSYYEIYTQPLCSLPDKSIMIPSVQISENVPEDFGMEVNEGRLLNSYDFTISSGNIAVLLGSDYIGTYEIGDSFDAEYLFYDYTFEVVGFLKEGLQIKRSDGTILLNDAVVMPSFSVHTMPKSDEEMLSYIIHYTNKTSGKLRMAPDRFEQIQNRVITELDAAGVGSFSCYTSSSQINYQKAGIDLIFVRTLSLVLSIAALIITIVLLKKYSALIMQIGCKYNIRSIFSKMALILILSNVFSVAAIWMFSQNGLSSWRTVYYGSATITANAAIIAIIIVLLIRLWRNNKLLQ